jgi:Flp pilus assembly protein TadD/serine/threonine protein kinase
MLTQHSTLARLSDDERAELESWLVEFDLGWTPDRLPAQVRELPAAGPLRLPALAELVKIDLERQWQHGRRVAVEDYLRDYPELARANGPPLDLIAVEMEVRARVADRPTEAELRARFPGYGEAIRELLAAAGARPFDPEPDGSRPPTVVQGNAPPVADGPGGLPGHYELVREIGRGGMGSVFEAYDPGLCRNVAVKVLREEYAGQSELTRRFLAEARTAGRLQHPGLVPIHAAGALPDGRPFFAMKLVDGQTLAEVLSVRPDRAHDRGRFLKVFEQACQAVAFAHSKGVIHRDLKPANVMVGSFGEVQVMDWGLAKAVGGPEAGEDSPDRRQETGPREDPDAATSRDSAPVTHHPDRTLPGSILGTPGFMAPEQARGEAADERADVFGLGGILAVILTGKPPFVGPETLDRTAAGDLSEASARLDGCGSDSELIVLCKRCLAPDPSDRPRDGGEVSAAVTAYLSGVEERARAAELRRAEAEVRAREERKRRRVQFTLAASVLVLFGLGGLGAWWRERGRAAEARARDGVESALARSAELRAGYRYDDAAAALDQAGRLIPADGPEDLRAALGRAADDLAFVRELDDIRMRRGTWIAEPGGKGYFDRAGAVERYPEAFRARGLDVLGADPAAVAAAVAASPVRAELVAALDDWADLPLDLAAEDRILEVLRRADPGPWLDTFRDPAVRKDPLRLWWLARSADAAALRPATLTALAEVMEAHKLDPTAVLLRAQFTHPGDFLIPFQLGRSHFLKREYEAAIAHYRAARVTRPGNPMVLNNLGLALWEKGDMDGAEAAYREAIRLNPSHAMLHFNLALALRGRGDLDGAVAEYREAVRLDPKDARPHNNLGTALREKGDLGGAVAASRDAIRLDPKLAQPHYNLGIALREKGDPDGAVKAYCDAIRLDPTDARFYTSLGLALWEKRDLDGAVAAYRDAIRLDPTDPRAHNNLGLALAARGDLSGAVAAYRGAIRLDPRHAHAHYNLGIVLRQQDDPEGAEKAYREAVRLDPKHAHAHNNLGSLLKARDDLDGAVAAFREAVAADPALTPARLNLGNALYAARDVAGAVATFREAVRADPAFAPAHFHLGNALYATGDVDGAIAALREAHRLDPRSPQITRNLNIALGKKAERDAKTAPPPRPVDR